jgi:D-alanine-D-alanine ligase
MPLELIAPADKNGRRFLSAAVKSADTESFIEVTDEGIKAKITTLALSIFHALGAQDYGRIDIRLDAFGIPQFLEANLIPSLIRSYGNFPKACLLNLGMGHTNMILHITRLGLARNKKMEELVAV